MNLKPAGEKFSAMTTSHFDQIMKTFGKRLKRARQAGGYDSAQAFAAVLGVEPHSYRKYERGEAQPNFEVLMRIKRLLRIRIDDLFPDDRSDSGSRTAAA